MGAARTLRVESSTLNGWQIFVEISGRPPVEVRPGESIIGRSRTAQVHIPDSTVSRQHARLVSGALGDLAVEDLGSSNGTYVNGDKLDGRRKLADGDRILIGDAELRVRIVAPVASTEATVRLSLPPLGAIQAAGAAPSLPPAAAAATFAPAPAAAPRDLPLALPLPPPPRQLPPPALLASPAGAPPAFAVTPPAGLVLPPLPPRPSAPPVAPPPLPPPPAMPPRTIDPPLRVAPPAPTYAAPPAPPPRVDPPPLRAAPLPPPRREVLPSMEEIEGRLPPRPNAPRPASAVAPATTAPLAAESAKSPHRPAGFWIRVAAALIDSVPSIAIAIVGVVLTFFVHPALGMLANLVVLPYAFYVALYLPATRGDSIGKKMLGLAIVSAHSRAGEGLGWSTAFIRFVGHMASSLLFGVGYLLVAFTSKKQGLHDMIANTLVVRLR